jgi:hypothetical protein
MNTSLKTITEAVSSFHFSAVKPHIHNGLYGRGFIGSALPGQRKNGPLAGCQRQASVLSQKFAKESSDKNAGPSTPFGAKNAPNFAQDDRICLTN